MQLWLCLRKLDAIQQTLVCQINGDIFINVFLICAATPLELIFDSLVSRKYNNKPQNWA